MTAKKRVLIATFVISNCAELPYIFQKAGCIVEVFCAKESWLLKNSHWDRWIEADISSPANFATALMGMAETGSYDWIILVDDYAVRIMDDTITDPILFRKIMPISKIENRSLLGSKAGLSQLCSNYNITTPSYLIYNGWPQMPSFDDAENISFPLLIKLDKSDSGQGVFLCNDKASFNERWNALPPENTSNITLQSYIVGDNIAVEALYKNGVLLGYASGIVKKTLGGEFGVSTEREYREYLGLESHLKKIGEGFGLHGFVTLTFMQDNLEKVYYLIEADPRPNEWIALCAFAGMDFSDAIRNYLSDAHVLLRPRKSMDNPVVIRHFQRDVVDALKRKDMVTFFKWCINHEDRFRDIPTYDPILFRTIVGHMITRGFYKIPKAWKKLTHAKR